MELRELDIAVIGGGIGGTAAACALAQRGAHVTLYEQADAWGEVGAGLQISANGQRVLRALSAVGDAAPVGATVSDGTIFRDGWSGRAVATVPAPKTGPTWYMHRADLLALLTDAAEAAGVRTEFERVVTPGTVQADVIVAADGGHSLWRSGIDGPDTARFTGQVAWRALVPWSADVPRHASLSMGHRAHVVSYPLRGGTLMNLVCVEERRDWREESWSQLGDAAELHDRFRDFGGAVGELIGSVETVHRWALHARPVAQRWQNGATVLVGDAAHPTLPFMAQGACLALEDAWVLADALTAEPDCAAALARYETLRRTRAARVVALADGNAWRFHLGRPLAWAAQAVLAVGAGALARRLEWVYGYDATQALAGR